jgi:hypothetical protein
MKSLKKITVIFLVLATIQWFFLMPRYSHPDTSILNFILIGLAPLGFVLVGLVPGAIFAILPIKKKDYKAKLEIFTCSFTIFFTIIFCIVSGGILFGINYLN